MTETHDLARHLLDKLTVSGTLTADEWSTFKTEPGIEARQVEPTLLLTLQHVLYLGECVAS